MIMESDLLVMVDGGPRVTMGNSGTISGTAHAFLENNILEVFNMYEFTMNDGDYYSYSYKIKTEHRR